MAHADVKSGLQTLSPINKGVLKHRQQERKELQERADKVGKHAWGNVLEVVVYASHEQKAEDTVRVVLLDGTVITINAPWGGATVTKTCDESH